MTKEERYNAAITEADLEKDIALDSKEYKLLTYAKSKDECDGIKVQLGNQAGGFPFTLLGREWKSVEFLYLCGEWSWKGDDAVEIQKDVCSVTSGYAAHRFKKPKYAKRVREDYNTFRHQWMLWCVWQKCLGSEAYRKHLLSMPDDRVIIEVVKRDPVWAAYPDEQGVYHGANGMGKILTICRRCLKEGSAPTIDTKLLNSKDIYIFGQKVKF